MSIQKNISHVNNLITRAAEEAGRNPADVKLVVVSKAQPVDKIRQVLECGAKILGENYPEETLPKILELNAKYKVEWHMIGHLQSRKAGIVAEYFDTLQSLDSVHLAQKLESQLALRGRELPVLLEMNVGGEESKSGWDAHNESSWPALLEGIEQICNFKHLKICGLMTMPPWNENPEVSRAYFKKLRKLRDYLQHAFPQLSLRELSMGTSFDFEVAVQEGASYVRVGQAILGERLLQK